MRVCLTVAAGLLLLSGCSKTEPVAEAIPAKTAEPTPLKQYELRGEVVRLDAKDFIATIKHEQIADWMGPMTMDFPVKDPADFAKLTVGKPMLATVNVQDFSYWVSGVQDTPAPLAK